ncbi:MAG: EF-hand domain-containing protein [Candidatus Omnitrophica bacterium]|nr:EF-hand domain-containing protein [Candidatus Omnitrophota bacterium]
MIKYVKISIAAFCIIFFSGINGFAQQDPTQQVITEFQKMDRDQNGMVTPDEMQLYQKEQFNELDKDKSGDLDAGELAADTTKMQQAADKDMNGKVTQEESNSQFKEYFQEIDKDKNGQISEAEYTDYWKLIHRF